jgi:hypothetical protein
MKFLPLLALLVVARPCLSSAAGNLVKNGSFEDQDVGVSVVSPPFSGIDSTTLTGWQVANTDLDKTVSFSVTVVGDASDGHRALRLDVTTLAPTWTHGITNWIARFPVNSGVSYAFSFDAAYVSGESEKNLAVDIVQYDSDDNFIGDSQITKVFSVSNTDYQTFTFTWMPVSSAARACVRLTPMLSAVGSTSLRIDNVKMEETP